MLHNAHAPPIKNTLTSGGADSGLNGILSDLAARSAARRLSAVYDTVLRVYLQRGGQTLQRKCSLRPSPPVTTWPADADGGIVV